MRPMKLRGHTVPQQLHVPFVIDEDQCEPMAQPPARSNIEPLERVRSGAGGHGTHARNGNAPGLAGVVKIQYRGRQYSAWYRVAGDLLTVYCGVAANTGLLPASSPSPKPLAERLLRDLIEAEHPGLNPE